jgi:hypothetical protein
MILIALAILIGLILLLVAFGHLYFNSKVQSEIDSISNNESKQSIIKKDDLDSLPDLLKNYLLKINITGKPLESSLFIEQKGKIRMYPSNKWLPFKANQFMSAKQPAFIWKANSFPMLVRDKFMDGKGEMKINLLGIKNIEVATGSEIDQGSLTRYLGELPVYPNALLDKRIKWEVIDQNALKATMQIENIVADGIFYFNKEGWVSSFKTKRYMLHSLKDFSGTFENFKEFNGLMIPTKLTAIWNLEAGDYPYFKCNIVNYELK